MFGGLYRLLPGDETGYRLYFEPWDEEENLELAVVYGGNCLVTPVGIVYQADEERLKLCDPDGTGEKVLWQSEGPMDVRLVNCDEEAVYIVRDGALMRLSYDGTWTELLDAEQFAACEGADILDGYLYTVYISDGTGEAEGWWIPLTSGE